MKTDIDQDQGISASYTLVIEVNKVLLAIKPQSNLLKHLFYSSILVNIEVISPLDVRDANDKGEAWKTHITRVLQQGTLVDHDAIHSRDTTSSLPRTGIIHSCSYDW